MCGQIFQFLNEAKCLPNVDIKKGNMSSQRTQRPTHLTISNLREMNAEGSGCKSLPNETKKKPSDFDWRDGLKAFERPLWEQNAQ